MHKKYILFNRENENCRKPGVKALSYEKTNGYSRNAECAVLKWFTVTQSCVIKFFPR